MKHVVYHILPHKTRGWVVRKSGSTRASGFAQTRRGAEKLVSTFYIRPPTTASFIVHDDTGRVLYTSQL